MMAELVINVRAGTGEGVEKMTNQMMLLPDPATQIGRP